MIFFVKFSILSYVSFESVSDILAVSLDFLCEGFSVVDDLRFEHFMPFEVASALYLVDYLKKI